MEDTVCGTLDAASEAVVFTVIVVVAHFGSWFFLDFDVSYCVFFDGGVVVTDWSAALVFDVVVWVGFAAVFAFGDVDLGLVGSVESDVGSAVVIAVCLLTGCGDVDVDLTLWLIVLLISMDALVLLSM